MRVGIESAERETSSPNGQWLKSARISETKTTRCREAPRSPSKGEVGPVFSPDGGL